MDRKKRILLVDDDVDVLELLAYNLTTHGYKVKTVPDASMAITEASRFDPDLIVLDMVMPRFNGIELCRLIRNIEHFSEVPIFFLTGKTESAFVYAALECGGDDLIHKMMGLRSLIQKIDSVLKEGWVIRKRIEKLVWGGLVLNRRTLSAMIGDRQIPLSVNEFELLYLLAQNPTKTVSAQGIKLHIWGSDIFQVASPVIELTLQLTKKLGVKCITQPKANQFRIAPRIATD